MCLAIPGKVVEMFQEHDVQMGKVDFGGVFKRVCLDHVPDVRIGQYVIVHAGFALSVIDEAEAQQNLLVPGEDERAQRSQAGRCL